jgi:hypothetical protein
VNSAGFGQFRVFKEAFHIIVQGGSSRRRDSCD